jgi:hypothetical protein
MHQPVEANEFYRPTGYFLHDDRQILARRISPRHPELLVCEENFLWVCGAGLYGILRHPRLRAQMVFFMMSDPIKMVVKFDRLIGYTDAGYFLMTRAAFDRFVEEYCPYFERGSNGVFVRQWGGRPRWQRWGF